MHFHQTLAQSGIKLQMEWGETNNYSSSVVHCSPWFECAFETHMNIDMFGFVLVKWPLRASKLESASFLFFRGFSRQRDRCPSI